MRCDDIRRLGREGLAEFRLHAVMRVQAGESPEELYEELGISRVTLYQWLAAYRNGGMAALGAKYSPGRPKTLNAKQLMWLYRTVATKSPLQLKFACALWTRTMIQELIKREFKVRLSLASVGRLLAQLGFSCHKPLHRAFERNPTLVERWIKREYPSIARQAKKEGAAIFFCDESGVRSDFHAGTTWSPKGSRPVLPTTGKRFSLNMISAISPQGALRFMVTKKRLTVEVFIDFLKRLLIGASQNVFLVLDRHPVHRSKEVAKCIESLQGKLRLFFLPPYAPDVNPDEQV
jgi:transposase